MTSGSPEMSRASDCMGSRKEEWFQNVTSAGRALLLCQTFELFGVVQKFLAKIHLSRNGDAHAGNEKGATRGGRSVTPKSVGAPQG